MKLIYIKWQDACSNSGWFKGDNEVEEWCKEEMWIVEQVGWLYKETKKEIVLICRKDGDKKTPGYGMLQKIPKTWILKRIDLTKFIK
jgi:hypothetical protein